MPHRKFPLTLLGLFLLVGIQSCTDVVLTDPGPADVGIFVPSSAPAGAIFEEDGFYFLPPLAAENPRLSGGFNPGLYPSMEVCELDVLGGDCDELVPLVAEYGPGSIAAGTSQYSLSWDTDGVGTGSFDTDRFYRLSILVAGRRIGSVELDPQDPNGPGQSDADAYAFRVGETIPVKFWISLDYDLSHLCGLEIFVTECAASFVVDPTGGKLALSSQGAILGLNVPTGSLPDSDPIIVVVIERIDNSLLEGSGTECIPLFDAPQYGECFRITTYPSDLVLTEDATISICVDPTQFDLAAELQEGSLTMIRYSETDGYQALKDANGECSSEELAALAAGLIVATESGDGGLDDGPSEERPIRLGGLTSSFSRFRFALPGTMIPAAGDGAVISTAGDNVIEAGVAVRDQTNRPVQDARVHFTTSDGSILPADGIVISDEDGIANVSWTVDVSSPGMKTLTATSLGLTADAAPDEDGNPFIVEDSVEIQVLVCPQGFGTADVSDGEFDASEWACANSSPFVANIGDGGVPAEVLWMNDADDLFIAVRVQQSSLDRANSLRIDFDNDGDGVAEVGDDAIGYRTDGGFFDEYLTQRCVNRAQSGCGASDTLRDGGGELTNDGVWTSYELMHPLDGTVPSEDLVAATVSEFGFYLSLQSGNGAKGNTQFPGFRSYLSFVPAGF